MAHIAMGLATLVTITAPRDTGAEGKVRLGCVANVAATVLAGVAYRHPTYS